jgi:hypothetical protein
MGGAEVKTNHGEPGCGITFRWDVPMGLFVGERVGGPGAKTAHAAQRDAAEIDALVTL